MSGQHNEIEAEEDALMVSALLEPAAGHTIDELFGRLEGVQAEIHRLSGDFVSFFGTQGVLKTLEDIADIHINPYQGLSERYL
jgi:hypothetical protein